MNADNDLRSAAEICGNSLTKELGMTEELFAFLNTLLRFNEEIEDRIPEYFTFHHLNLFAETAEFSHYYAAISTVLGIDIRTVSAMEDLNPIEEVLHPRLIALHSISSCFDWSEFDADASPELIVRTFLNEYNRIKSEQVAQAQQAVRALQKKTINLSETQALNYYVGGAGENTIVIVNAFGQSLAYWTMLVANLVKSHRVIIWLPRGNENLRGGAGQANPITVHV